LLILEEEEKNKRLDCCKDIIPGDNISRRVVLASGSPRRKKILENLRIDFDVIKPSGAVEKSFKNPRKTVLYNSGIKAQFVYNHGIINCSDYRNCVIAGFDTVVYLNGRNLGKPQGLDQAYNFLQELSGKTHRVITGVSIIDFKTGNIASGSETTIVKFRSICPRQIADYLSVEDVFDKAGAYDISGYGAMLVEKINGCFYNVAGLPVYRFFELLKEI
jgi:septum formation protein